MERRELGKARRGGQHSVNRLEPPQTAATREHVHAVAFTRDFGGNSFPGSSGESRNRLKERKEKAARNTSACVQNRGNELEPAGRRPARLSGAQNSESPQRENQELLPQKQAPRGGSKQSGRAFRSGNVARLLAPTLNRRPSRAPSEGDGGERQGKTGTRIRLCVTSEWRESEDAEEGRRMVFFGQLRELDG